jgi:Integrase core domain/Calcineurin-like phosphoesterase
MTKKPSSRAAKKSGTRSRGTASDTVVHRFAHPFFTNVPILNRPTVPDVGKRMTDFVATVLQPIPDPIRNPPTMTLADIVGKEPAKAIEQSGSITFHAVGDTGHVGGGTEDMQEFVAEAMAADFDINRPDVSPAFFFHLGDVNYFDNTDKGYNEQFDVPYKRYPGKIIAIPGNHDGEIFKFDGTSVGQKTTLEAFIRNFVQPKASVPPAAGSILRQMVSHPGVFWNLDEVWQVKTFQLRKNESPIDGHDTGARLREAGVRVVLIPERAPNANAYAERFVRSIKEECLSRVIPIGERHLRRAVAEFVDHYHRERNHQGLDNRLIAGSTRLASSAGRVRRHSRLGGLLNFYQRAA